MDAEQHSPVVDPTVLDGLTARLGDRALEFRVTLVDTWHNEAALRLTQLDAALAAGQAGDVARVAHALRSGSAALGALRLAALCQDVERRLGAGGDHDLASDVAHLHIEVAAAGAALSALR